MKSVIWPTGKASDLSPSAYFPTFSFTAGTDQDSIDSPSIKDNPDRELEPVVPYIILKPKEEEEEEAIASNLRAGFKERQRKHLSKSLPTASPPAKRTYTEGPHEVLVLNTLLTLMPPSDAAGSNQTLIASSSTEKDVVAGIHNLMQQRALLFKLLEVMLAATKNSAPSSNGQKATWLSLRRLLVMGPRC
ncbi:hypothetical protein PVL29_015916 [Vitis rotundifolia]|uniref:Uncharacterized protein n=1 Tax=Vitis rotundifolia TaxID=103349 RepID=A0AA38ZF72_VITRO|nr:hypothetical protein PVL29_015916 [Vitis rotundifolia]